MELSQYLGRIWRLSWLILAIALLAAALDVAVLWAMPRQYHATTTLKVGGIHDLLATPGTISNNRATLPSAVQPTTDTYLTLLESTAVKQEAVARVQGGKTVTQNSSVLVSNGADPSASEKDFTYEGRAEAVKGGNSDYIFIDVAADQADKAKLYADTLASVLMDEVAKTGADTAEQFVQEIQTQEVDPINQRLSDIRTQIDNLKTSGGDATDQDVKISALQDEAQALTDTRKQYTDSIAKIRLNDALNKNDLQVLSVAAVPAAKKSPDYLRSGVVAAFTGLIVGLIAVLAVDRRRSSKSAAIF